MNSPVSAEQKLWKVSVLCEGIVPADIGVKKPKPSRIERRYTTVLLNAADSDAALKAGWQYAEANADSGVQWKCFTSLSAARFVLPVAIEDLR